MKNPTAIKSALSDSIARARCLVFDFDGTLVDSLPIKRRAFEQLAEGFPLQRQEILAYCKGFNHTTRGDKFRHIYEKILGLPYTPEIEAALHERFEAQTTRRIAEAPALPGAVSFVRDLCRGRQTAVLSSTPHEILVRILAQRRWLDLFGKVQGAPVDKAAWLGQLLQENGWRPTELIFFGDTWEDLRSAASAGCTFVAVREESLRSETIPFIPDFTALLSHEDRR